MLEACPTCWEKELERLRNEVRHTKGRQKISR